MRPLTTRILGACAALLLGATLASAQIDDSRTTVVTFSAPVALPGVTLPAGSYLFKLADSQTNRNIVQVFDKDRSKIFAMIIAIPAQRNEVSDETVITFREAPANAAPAVRYWYYPGEKSGQEFAYPKKQAISIASAAHTSVLAVDTESENFDDMKGGNITRVEPGAETTEMPTAKPEQPQTPPPVTTPVTEQTAPAPQPTTTAPTPVATSGTATSLPHTASRLPLIGFAGLLALLGAAGVRALRRATV